MNDRKLVKWLLLLLLFPLGLAMYSQESYRYPCQNPANWDKDFCKMPLCDVTRTCPEHIFKGQRDPRLGPPKDDNTKTNVSPGPTVGIPGAGFSSQGVNCGK
jgi:hypothetical protein